MLRYELLSHLIPSLIYLSIISLFKIGHFGWVDYLLFWLGGAIGTYLIDIDHLIFCLFSRPDLPCSLKFQELFQKKDYKNALKVLAETHFEHTEMIFHNAIFLPIWVVFSLFIITSSASLFASALVMTVYLHLLKDIWNVIKLKNNYQLDWLFWQIKRPLTEKIKKYYVWAISVIFLLETLILLS